MSSYQEYSQSLPRIAEQREDWVIKSESPLTITRQTEEQQLPLSIALHGKDEKAHLFFNLYDGGPFTDMARKFLRINQQDDFRQKDDESGLVIIIDSDGIAAVLDATELNYSDFEEHFDEFVRSAEGVLDRVCQQSYGKVKEAQESENGSPKNSNSDAEQPSFESIDTVVKRFFTERNYKFQHNEKRQRFVFGFNTEKYVDSNGDQNVGIVINYSDSDLLRFETPFLYKFDLNEVEYSLIATAIVWFQFRYKFLSMSLDPSDGELKVSIDIPLGQASLHTSQVNRIVSFIVSFTEETYEELFSLLLSDKNAAQEKLNTLFDERKAKAEEALWYESIKEKMSGLTPEQKKQIEEIVGHQDDGGKQGGI
ncbi:hypothetical protein QTP81_16600 [Alteromonas sp. ASW11-36]|uniref:YbjN domain-containing protein n=1 Tax=Alteromonas arenosi TaxID=3055817 RepID=A0ABT7T1A6_9ALTE|nr:hypothetical protein [Alteromonas sp. ASW11-36]MDM7862228.1 hypothetical protein [Alteromonas sp. ASW11-36]